MRITMVHTQATPYTSAMQHYPSSPTTLFILGSLPEDRRPSVAIVGSRKPTAYGKEVTYRFAYDLAKQGVVIISGLAYGVDITAHKAALDAGGTTLAVLAGGLDDIYPASHQRFAEQIVESGGAIISEYPVGTISYKANFLARNRIVSGLSDAVLVTEAAERSGTLSTVAHALEQGKEVFAIPGPITSPLSIGPNRLLAQGAHCVLSYKDILAVVAPELAGEEATELLSYSEQEKAIISLIKKGVRSGEELQRQSGLSASEFSQTLTMLEITGTIKPLGGNKWTVR